MKASINTHINQKSYTHGSLHCKEYMKGLKLFSDFYSKNTWSTGHFIYLYALYTRIVEGYNYCG